MLSLLSGTVEQWIEGEKRILSPGDAVFVSRGVVHASFNTGSEDAKFLVVLAVSRRGWLRIRRSGGAAAVEPIAELVGCSAKAHEEVVQNRRG